MYSRAQQASRRSNATGSLSMQSKGTKQALACAAEWGNDPKEEEIRRKLAMKSSRYLKKSDARVGSLRSSGLLRKTVE